MIPRLRQEFNQSFSPKKHAQLLRNIEKKSGGNLAFKISESPIFLSSNFYETLMELSKSIIHQIKKLDSSTLSKAIPKEFHLPNDSDFPHFLILDFGICENNNKEIVPQLIELQAFPSLFGFMKVQEECLINTYPFLSELRTSLPKEAYFNKLKNLIIGDTSPENVILLEIFPEKQKTQIDFKIMENELQIQTVCATQILKEGKNLFYEKNGKKIQILKIYNRLIFEELSTYKNLNLKFDFTENLNVEWVTHPNWFYKISKYILPQLSHPNIPKSYYANEFPPNEDLANFVLKPLFSFASNGVNLHPNEKNLTTIKNPEHYILQRKVKYSAIFEDIHSEFSKAEIRLMYILNKEKKEYELMNNLVRMTRAELISMNSFSNNSLWEGCSFAFFCDK